MTSSTSLAAPSRCGAFSGPCLERRVGGGTGDALADGIGGAVPALDRGDEGSRRAAPSAASSGSAATAACSRRRTTPAPARARAGSMASGATGRSQSAPKATWSPTCWPGSMSTDAGRTRFRRYLRAVAGREVPDRHRRRLDPAPGAVSTAARCRRRTSAKPRADCCRHGGAAGLDRPPLRGAAHRCAPAAAWRRRRVGAEGAQLGRGAERPRRGFREAARQDPRQPRGGRCRGGAGLGRERQGPELADQAARWRPKSTASMRRGRSRRRWTRRPRIWPPSGAAARAAGGAHGLPARPAMPSSAWRRRRALLRHCAMSCRRSAAGPRRLGCWTCRWPPRANTSAPRSSCAVPTTRAPRPARGMIARLKAGADAAYGSGLIGARERAELNKSFGPASRPTRSSWATPGGAAVAGPVARPGVRRHCASISARRWTSLRQSSRWPNCSSRTSCAAARCWPIRRGSTRCRATPTAPPACSTGCSAARSVPASPR